MTRRTQSLTGDVSKSGIDVFGRGLLASLERVRYGELRLRWCDGRTFVFRGPDPGPQTSVSVIRPSAVRRAILGGSIGLAEAYMQGAWETSDLTATLEFSAANVDAARERGRKLLAPLNPLNRAIHSLRTNTKRGAKRNICFHYDLGNEFYRLWLDPDMTYSAALFDGTDTDLSAAQQRKWDRLLDLLDVRPGQSLLEIGCGWGGFAIHAAKTRGARVTGVTISEEQLAWARQRVAEEGLGSQVEIRHQDYRDIAEKYDRVASIEMFEAVGERYWPTFFGKLNDVLADGGRAALQVITIENARLDAYRRKPDFIQRYIFPGGMLPSPEAFRQTAERAGLRTEDPFFFGHDYAQTLNTWEQRFSTTVARVRALGFDDRFERMWRFYLAYCQAGFRSGSIDVMQVVRRPARR